MNLHEPLLQQIRAALPAGATLRPVVPHVDAAVLVDLVNTDSAHVGNPIRDSIDDMMEELTRSEIEVARDTLVAVAPDGTAIGFAFANRVTNPEKPRVFLDAVTGPLASSIFLAMPRRSRWIAALCRQSPMPSRSITRKRSAWRLVSLMSCAC